MRRRARLRLVVLRAGRRLHARLARRRARRPRRRGLRARQRRACVPHHAGRALQLDHGPALLGVDAAHARSVRLFGSRRGREPRGGERTARPRASADVGTPRPAVVRPQRVVPRRAARAAARPAGGRPRPLPRTHRAVRRGQRADHLPRRGRGHRRARRQRLLAPARPRLGARGARPRARDRSRGGTLRERVRRHDARPQAGALLRADPRPRRERRADQRRRVPGPHPAAVPAGLRSDAGGDRGDDPPLHGARAARRDHRDRRHHRPVRARCARRAGGDLPALDARLLPRAGLRRPHHVGRDRQVHLDPRLLRGGRRPAAFRRGVPSEARVLRDRGRAADAATGGDRR